MDHVSVGGKGSGRTVLLGQEPISVASLRGLSEFAIVVEGAVPDHVDLAQIQEQFESKMQAAELRLRSLDEVDGRREGCVVTLLLNSHRVIPIGPGLYVVTAEILLYQWVTLLREPAKEFPAVTWLTMVSSLASGKDVHAKCLDAAMDCAKMFLSAMESASALTS
ncbi:MAG: hypothetical protein LC772_12130 [Chloroflexi bacterium]|nr:hypothetical protein [Chloroflexota bacterium]